MIKRDEKTMLDLILQVANNHKNICAVIMNGSRASPEATKDNFQDFDVVYSVKEVSPFVEHQDWLKSFGERLMMQTPDEMDGIWPKSKDQFAFLMQFKDGNRIDLTLIQEEKFAKTPRDSQSILLLDKDKKLGEFEPPSDKDYLPKPPTEKEFKDCCAEFLWVSIYVAKGILRKQLTYTKIMSEQIVKNELIKLLGWQAAIQTNYKKSMGAYGKYLEQYLESDLWGNFRKTYVDAEDKHIWEGLFIMCELFDELALKISMHYGYQYDQNQCREVVDYLKSISK